MWKVFHFLFFYIYTRSNDDHWQTHTQTPSFCNKLGREAYLLNEFSFVIHSLRVFVSLIIKKKSERYTCFTNIPSMLREAALMTKRFSLVQVLPTWMCVHCTEIYEQKMEINAILNDFFYVNVQQSIIEL